MAGSDKALHDKVFDILRVQNAMDIKEVYNGS